MCVGPGMPSKLNHRGIGDAARAQRSFGDSGTARTVSPSATPSAVGGVGQQRKAIDARRRVRRRSRGSPRSGGCATSHRMSSVRLSGTGSSSPSVHRQHLRLAHRVDVVAKAFDAWARRRRCRRSLRSESLPAPASRAPARVSSCTSPITSRAAVGQQVHVHRMLRHQLGDERLLADAGQVVGGRILHREEVPAEAFPERAACRRRRACRAARR